MSRKVIIGCLLSSFTMISAIAKADNHTFSLGYAQSKVQYLKNIRGVNIQYRYEWDSPVSFISSFSYMNGNDHSSSQKDFATFKQSINTKYYSLLAGPAYRFNDYVSLYGIVGLARATIKNDVTNSSERSLEHSSNTANTTSIAYGVGFSINPVKNIAVNIGYEGTRTKIDENISINGFNLGVGYRF